MLLAGPIWAFGANPVEDLVSARFVRAFSVASSSCHPRVKTVAILPRPELNGLGRILIVGLLKNAIAMEYGTAISALMHTDNRSQKISRDCAGPMRGYTLFGRALR